MRVVGSARPTGSFGRRPPDHDPQRLFADGPQVVEERRGARAVMTRWSMDRVNLMVDPTTTTPSRTTTSSVAAPVGEDGCLRQG